MDGKKAELDGLDREILNRVQVEVPLAPRPFAALGEELGIGEAEVIERLRRMWDLGIIRRLGPIINYPAWGMSGALVAAKLDEDRVDAARKVVAEFPEITHAYLRDHEWRLWFTVIAEDEEKRAAIIEMVSARAGLEDVRVLPKKKSYKLGVKFEA